MKHSYDYTPLSLDISYDQAKIELPKIDTKYKLVTGVFVFVILVLSALALSGIVKRGDPFWPLLVVIGIIMLAPFLYYLYHRRNTVRAAKLQRFAQANNIAAIQASAPDAHVGMLFETGHNRLIISGITTEDQIEVGTYRYVTGGGRSARTHHFTYFSVPLASTYPNFVMDSKKNNTVKNSFYSGFSLNAPVFIKKNQKISFDTQFDDVYKVYVTAEGHEALKKILTDDVRAKLLQYIPNWDMEIVGNRLVVFSPGQVDLTHADTLRSLIAKADSLRAVFDGQGPGDETDNADSAVEPVPTYTQRLRRSLGWLMWVIIIYIVVSIIVNTIL